MRIEEINRLKAFASDFCVKVESARCEPAHFQDCEHDLGSQVKTGRELVSVPANHFIACVGVKRTKRAGGDGDLTFMMHREWNSPV
jgi:hypothetical protein